MRKIIFKIIFSLVVLQFLAIPLLAIPSFALADGMVIWPDPYSDRWDYGGESNQEAFINYEDGLEKMIISIGMEHTDTEAVWIFPVPSAPDRVVIDILIELPRLYGEEITDGAKSELMTIKEVIYGTQIYGLFFVSLGGASYVGAPGMVEGALGAPGFSTERDVVVHEHLEKEGVTTEIITAKTGQGLYSYLQDKGLNVEQGSIPVLDDYIGKEFTFVVSWISASQELLPYPEEYLGRGIYPPPTSKQRGIFVTFPTDKIYYPLLPTSVYGSEVVPATIRVMEFVRPEVFQDIKAYTETEYFIDSYFSIDSQLKNFYNGTGDDVRYTKIEINAPSKMLTDDLWINRGGSLKSFFASFIMQHPLITFIVLLVLLSALTGVLVGVIVFREARTKRGWIKFGILGLFNCLTIIGLIIATISIRTKKIKEEDKELFMELKKRGYAGWTMRTMDWRKLVFVPVFSVFFLIVSWIIIKLIILGL